MPPELREFLLRICELLRIQQQALFDLHVATSALETALRTNESFAQLHDQAKEHVRAAELVQAHELGIAVLDSLIRQLGGGPTGQA